MWLLKGACGASSRSGLLLSDRCVTSFPNPEASSGVHQRLRVAPDLLAGALYYGFPYGELVELAAQQPPRPPATH